MQNFWVTSYTSKKLDCCDRMVFAYLLKNQTNVYQEVARTVQLKSLVTFQSHRLYFSLINALYIYIYIVPVSS